MRVLLALLLVCLMGCAALPPTMGGVLQQGSCTVYWQPEDFPLHVVVDRRLSPARQEALQSATLRWNEEVGETVFTIDREIDWYDRELLHPRRSTIYVILLDLPDHIPGETTQGWCSLEATQECQILHGLVFLDLAAPDETATLIFTHELGHAVGLSHDSWQPSIMYRHANSSGGQVMQDDINFIQWEMGNGRQRDSSLSAPTSQREGVTRDGVWN